MWIDGIQKGNREFGTVKKYGRVRWTGYTACQFPLFGFHLFLRNLFDFLFFLPVPLPCTALSYKILDPVGRWSLSIIILFKKNSDPMSIECHYLLHPYLRTCVYSYLFLWDFNILLDIIHNKVFISKLKYEFVLIYFM